VLAGEGRFEENFDILDQRSSFAMVGGSLD
jgi:hypothetical protein